MKARMKLLRNPNSRLRCSPYGCTAARLDAISGCSRRFLRTFTALPIELL
jgi:hypothetical protein